MNKSTPVEKIPVRLSSRTSGQVLSTGQTELSGRKMHLISFKCVLFVKKCLKMAQGKTEMFSYVLSQKKNEGKTSEKKYKTRFNTLTNLHAKFGVVFSIGNVQIFKLKITTTLFPPSL